MLDVAIIIVSYNTKKLTSACIESVFEKTKNLKYEIYVIDNASHDGSPDFLESNYHSIKVLRNDKNSGFAAANNIALRQVDAKYVFFLNPDTVLLNNAIKVFFDFMESNDDQAVACCGGNLFDINMNPHLSYGNFPSLKQIFFEQFFLHRVFPKAYRNIPNLGVSELVHEVKEVPYISGADLFVRKEVLDVIGGFDERFFLYYEDTDLGYRVKKAGFKSVIVPDAKIIHLVGGSSQPSTDKFRIMKKSEFLFLRKNFGSLQVFFAKVFYLAGCFLRFLLKRDPQQFRYMQIIVKS